MNLNLSRIFCVSSCSAATHISLNFVDWRLEMVKRHWAEIKVIIMTSWSPRRCPGLFHNFIVKKSRADWSKDPAGFGLWWAPHKLNFTWQTHPRSNFCLLAPTLFSLQIPPFGRVDPAGFGLWWAPRKLNFTWQTHPEEQLLFAGPC